MQVASRSTVRRPNRSASGPEMKMDTVEATAIEVTAQPSSNAFKPNSASMKPTAPVNSEPSKPMRKPLSATIRMVPIARWRFAPHHAGRPTESRSMSLGSNTCCTSRSLLVVDVLEHPARRHARHVGDRIVHGGELRIDIARNGRVVEADDGKIGRHFETAFMRGRHGARGHFIVGADHRGERDVLLEQRVQRVLAAGLVIVAFVQQAIVELDARLGQRSLVAGEALLRVHPVERTGNVRDAFVFALAAATCVAR